MQRILFIAVILVVSLHTVVRTQIPYFKCTSNTGNNATVIIPANIIPSINGVMLADGDEIGVFTPQGLCAGMAIWGGTNLSITVWGNDDQTPLIDGFRIGEEISFRAYSHTDELEYEFIRVEYSSQFPATTTTGVYGVNQIYVLGLFESYLPIPFQPVLVSPVDDATDVETRPLFRWNSVRVADTYGIHVATDNQFSSIVIDEEDIADTSFRPDEELDHKTLYYWRVNGTNATGTGEWSEISAFTTIIDFPAVPRLVSPSDEALNQPVNLIVIWRHAEDADHYELQISTQQNFATTVVNQSSLSDTLYNILGLQHKTVHYWRVRAVNSRGSGDWSTPYSFMTIVPFPGSPDLLSPPDEAGLVPVDETFIWGESTDAQTYQIQIDRAGTFTNPVVNQSNITQLFYRASGLDNNTRHYWRVRASNVAGNSEWSTVKTFTTIIAFPQTPALSTPANETINVPVNPTLTWNPGQDATAYRIQVSAQQNFASLAVDTSGIQDTSVVVGGLIHQTRYFWRVRSENYRGMSNWSEIRSFITSPKLLSLKTPAGGEIWQAGTQQSISWEYAGVSQIRIEFNPNDGSGWREINASANAVNASYSWNVTDISSLNSVIRITDINDPGLTASSQPFAIYPATVPVDLDLSFGTASSVSSYRMVGLPGNMNHPIAGFMRGVPNTDWTAYFDNGQNAGYLQEYDQSSAFMFRPGRGFWLLSRNDLNFDIQVASVPLASDKSFSIPLHPGWNIISNPFNVPVDWNAVRQANSITGTIWDYDGSYAESSVLVPFKGYYYFNPSQNASIRISYPNGNSLPKSPDDRETYPATTLTLRLAAEHTASSPVRVHIRNIENAGNSSLIQYAPPGDFSELSITMQNDDLPTEYKLLSEDEKTLDEGGIAVKLIITSRLEARSRLTFEGSDLLDAYELLLIDNSTGKQYDVHAGEVPSLPPGEIRATYTLLIGTADYIREIADRTVPETYHLSQNYPNPFNPSTTIEYSIPETQDGVPVSIDIFNLLGQHVRSLVRETQRAGFYRIEWNALDESGRSVPSGIYFYRIQAGEFRATKKMIFAK